MKTKSTFKRRDATTDPNHHRFNRVNSIRSIFDPPPDADKFNRFYKKPSLKSPFCEYDRERENAKKRSKRRGYKPESDAKFGLTSGRNLARHLEGLGEIPSWATDMKMPVSNQYSRRLEKVKRQQHYSNRGFEDRLQPDFNFQIQPSHYPASRSKLQRNEIIATHSVAESPMQMRRRERCVENGVFFSLFLLYFGDGVSKIGNGKWEMGDGR